MSDVYVVAIKTKLGGSSSNALDRMMVMVALVMLRFVNMDQFSILLLAQQVNQIIWMLLKKPFLCEWMA